VFFFLFRRMARVRSLRCAWHRESLFGQVIVGVVGPESCAIGVVIEEDQGVAIYCGQIGRHSQCMNLLTYFSSFILFHQISGSADLLDDLPDTFFHVRIGPLGLETFQKIGSCYKLPIVWIWWICDDFERSRHEKMDQEASSVFEPLVDSRP
jgi:hypothetical protein